MERLFEINTLQGGNKAVVQAARESLLIGQASTGIIVFNPIPPAQS